MDSAWKEALTKSQWPFLLVVLGTMKTWDFCPQILQREGHPSITYKGAAAHISAFDEALLRTRCNFPLLGLSLDLET